MVLINVVSEFVNVSSNEDILGGGKRRIRAWHKSGRWQDPSIPTGLREEVLIGSLNWKCPGISASGTAGSSCSNIFHQDCASFPLSNLLFAVSAAFPSSLSYNQRQRCPLPHTLGIYAMDHLAAPVKRECFFLNSYGKRSPRPSSPWTDLGHVLLSHQITMHLMPGVCGEGW